jgi:Spy/CpxP family protein refolding chaperone
MVLSLLCLPGCAVWEHEIDTPENSTMKIIRPFLTLAASLAVLAPMPVAFTQSGGSHGPEPMMVKRMIARVEAKLNITSEQAAQIKAILKAEEPTIIALADQAKAERSAMTALPAYNDVEVRDIAQKYAATNTNIVVERAKLRLELRGVLTPQQLEQLEKLESRITANRMDGQFGERLDMVIGQL